MGSEHHMPYHNGIFCTVVYVLDTALAGQSPSPSTMSVGSLITSQIVQYHSQSR